MERRPLYESLWAELSGQKAMTFMAGPRQAGKTTLARRIASGFEASLYFNYDVFEDRRRLAENPSFFEAVDLKGDSPPLIVLDEIHKYRRWKNYLKGVYDGHADRFRFLVLGSGRLNVFQKGGDSLAGRYLLFTLFPFTLAELAGRRREFKDFWRDPLALGEGAPRSLWEQLLRLGGFPEPFLSGSDAARRRWAGTYRHQLIREDIRNATEIKNIDDMELLHSLLPGRVGAPISMDALARDLQVSFNSVRSWLEVFEAFFLTFRLSPWTKRVRRAIRKERKLYFFDAALVPEPGARFENAAALELWRAVSHWNDWGWGDFSLHYVRNREKEEVDFLIAEEGHPRLLVEAKSSDAALGKPLLKIQSELKVPAVQLVNATGIHRRIKNDGMDVLVVSAERWLAGLP